MTKSKLATLTLRTSLDAEYTFPDVPEEDLKCLVRALECSMYQTQITLTNVSGACLVLPVRIVTSISINGVKSWPV